MLSLLSLHTSALSFLTIEAVVQRCSVKRVFLETSQNSQENTCATVSFLIKFPLELPMECHLQDCHFIKKKTVALVFSFEFCEIFKNILFYRAPPVTVPMTNIQQLCISIDYCALSFIECKLTLINFTKTIVNASLFFQKKLL